MIGILRVYVLKTKYLPDNLLVFISKSFHGFYNYIHTYLAQTPEIGQGLGRFLSCGARKQEQT